MSWQRLRTLVIREARATLRDPFTVAILVAVPIMAMLLFGFMLSTEVHHLDLAVHDADGSIASRRLLADVAASGAFDLHPTDTVEALEQALVDGTASVGMVIPPDFSADLARRRAGGPPPEVQVLHDGVEAVLAANAEGYLRGLLAAYGASLASGPAPPGRVTVTTNALFNARLDGRPFMVAGVFGFVLSFLTTLITAVTIVNERLAGTFDQLQVTPATSLEILLGKLLPLGGMFAIDVVLMVLVGGFTTGVWPRGNLVFFFGVSVFYVLVSLAMGLLFSATSATPAEAVQKTVLSSIPLIQLSGFAFPIRNMPVPVQWLAELFPATHYLRVSRAIYLRAEGPLALWPEILLIALFGVVLLGLALRTLEART